MNPSNELSNAKTESKDIFKNLKCDFFLQKLFYNLLKKKSLNIIKYNNNIKERINLSIKDYKEYSELYSSIEIEIKPVKNEYGKFIEMNEENKKYFHIYFNDNKEEIKRNYLNENDNVEKLKIIIDYQIKSFKQLFYFCECIESLKSLIVIFILSFIFLLYFIISSDFFFHKLLNNFRKKKSLFKFLNISFDSTSFNSAFALLNSLEGFIFII